MAFLSDIKKEICNTPAKAACCRRALLSGLLMAKGRIEEEEIMLSLSDPQVMAYAVRLIAEQLGRKADECPMCHGGRLSTVRFQSAAALRLLREEIDAPTLTARLKCEDCSLFFLRGVFLASGRIADPQKSYRIELSLGERALAFQRLFKTLYGFNLLIAKRREETLLYVKDSSVVEDVVMMLGINEAAFSLMNAKIEKQFRNEVNRRTNCEAGNIARSVTAAARIVSVLERLERENLLSSLPDELEDAARLRLAHPEASLSQLAAMMTPPITKSGLNHRLNRVLTYAQSLASLNKQ